MLTLLMGFCASIIKEVDPAANFLTDTFVIARLG